MNTDKIYAEQLANEYAPKDTYNPIICDGDWIFLSPGFSGLFFYHL